MTQSKTQNIDNLIAKYFANEILSEEELRQVFLWKEENKKTFSRLEQIITTNKKKETHITVDTESAWQKILQNRHAKQTKIFNRRNFLLQSSIAASIALLLGIGSWFLFSSKQDIEYYKTAQQTKEILLPDGSEITLNKYASIEYEVNMKHERNIKLLKGEAFFNVAKDKSRPFKIFTKHLKIKVLGTSFNVKNTSNSTEVSVKTGQVSISNTDTTIMLQKGEKGFIKNGKLQKTLLTDDNYLAWKNRSLSFQNKSLKEAIPLLESYFDIKIKVDNFSNDCFITTKFTTETIEEALQELKIILDCKYQINNKTIILYDIKCN